MRAVVFLVAMSWTALALADLYRWVDPETGSIKYSSYPPPWVGDPQQERRAPRVERIPAGRTEPVVKPETPLELLDVRRKEMLQGLLQFSSRDDFNRAGSGLKQQLGAFQAVSAELDKLDPRGAAARKSESQALLDKLIEGLRAPFASWPPPGAPVAPAAPAAAER